MPELTPVELAYLRDQRPYTARIDWYLAVAPYGGPCFTARVNGVPANNRTIVYDGGTATIVPADEYGGLTLWVGSTPRGNDLGMVRVRTITDPGGGAVPPAAGTIIVAENDDIDWDDNLYLTCPGAYGFRELWSTFPRYTEAGGIVTFYEDYDETYNDPVDDVLPPKANAGPPMMAYINPITGHADVDFVGDRSFTNEIGATIVAYTWDFADGVVVAGGANLMGTCAAPNTVRWTTPGFRYVSLTVTDDTAQARTGIVYVPVWVFDADNYPYTNFEILSHSAAPNHRMTFRVYCTDPAYGAYGLECSWEDVIYNFPDGALIVVSADTIYGDTDISVGGFCDRENIRYVGWLIQESLVFDAEGGYVEFEVYSSDGIMAQLPGYATTYRDDDTPSTWYEINDLNLDRALHALLERRSTVNQVCHVEPVGDGAGRPIKTQPFPKANLYSQCTEHLLKDAMCSLLADRQGILRVTRDPQMMTVAQRNTVDVVCELVQSDTLNDITEAKAKRPSLGFVRLGGVAYETALLSIAPGVASRQQENEYRSEGYLVQNQAELNLWSGCTLTKANNEYPQIPIELVGYWPVFDPAFQEYVQLTLVDPLNRNVLEGVRAIVREVSWEDLFGEGTSRTSLVVELENDILYGETQVIPEAPPPAPVIYNPPPGPTPPPNWCGTLDKVILRTSQGIFVTNNFDELNPDDVVWEASNSNLSPDQRENIVDMGFDYNHGTRLFMIVETYDNTMAMADKGVFRCTDVFGIGAWDLCFDDQWVQDYLCIVNGQPNCGVGSSACPANPNPPYTGSNPNPCIGCFRAIGVDPVTGQIGLIGGAEDTVVATKSCRCYGIGFYSADALATCIMAATDFLHSGVGHLCVWQPRDMDGGHLSSNGGTMLYTYGCAWSAGSDRHRAYSLDGGNIIVTANGEIFSGHFSLWHTVADNVVIYYTTELGSGNGDDIAISLDGGITFTVWADVLPDPPEISGQALTLHFLDTNHVMMTDVIARVLYYSPDGGFTWGACADQSPNEPFCIAACADTSWPIPDGYGYIVGGYQPSADDEWVWLTRDMGASWENRTGNLGDFLDHTLDVIWQIIPVQSGC